MVLTLCWFGMQIPALAHGDMDHILGTVTKIDGSVISVEKNGTTTQVLLTPSTTYETNGVVGKQEDLRVGDRVVIHAMKMNGREVAHEVRLVHATAQSTVQK